jgi:hypothetical protein
MSGIAETLSAIGGALRIAKELSGVNREWGQGRVETQGC